MGGKPEGEQVRNISSFLGGLIGYLGDPWPPTNLPPWRAPNVFFLKSAGGARPFLLGTLLFSWGKIKKAQRGGQKRFSRL